MKFRLQRAELFKPKSKSAPVLSVAITPDGNFAFSSGLDFVLREWDLRSRECTRSWEAGGPLNAIMVTPCGKWILASTVMGVLQWDLQRWYFVRAFIANEGGTEDIAYSKKLGMLVGAGEDSLIYRWDLESGEKYPTLGEHQYPVSALSLGEHGELLFSGDSGGEIRVWDLASGKCMNVWQGHRGKITNLAFLPRTQRVVSSSWETGIKIWDLNSGTLLFELTDHTVCMETPAVSGMENWLITGGENGIYIWDLEKQKNIYHNPSANISCLALRHDHQHIISGSRDGSLSTWMFQPLEEDAESEQQS
ncbi:MAG: WD40 repeat domain-containing protein [Anaerolineales bacterium]|jgi:WD40 repeat protein